MTDNVIEIIFSGKDEFSSSFKKLDSAFGGLAKVASLAGAAVAAVATSMFAIAKSAANAQDQIQKLSEKTGIAVDSLSELAHAGELSNVSIETISTSIRFLQRGMTEASRGSTEYAKEFRNLGISVTDSSGQLRDTNQVLQEAADRISAIQSPAERSAAAMRLFGRGGTEMLPLLREGSEGLRRMAEDARFLGVSMNAQATANAALFNDELDRVGQAVKGVGLGIGNDLIPMLTGLANATANWIASNRSAIVEWSKLVFEGLIRAYVTAKQIITGVMSYLTESFSSAKGFDAFVQNMKHAFLFMFDFAAKVLEKLAVLMVGVFKMVWESFFELGKWAWMKVFDFVSGNDLADSLGDVLFARIPEATKETRDAMNLIVDDMKVTWVDAAETMINAVGSTIGVTAETIDAELARIRETYTMTAEVIKEQEKGVTQETLEQLRQRSEAERSARISALDDQIYFAASMSEVLEMSLMKWSETVSRWQVTMSESILGTMNAMVDGLSMAVGNAIVYGENLGEAIKKTMQSAAASVIAMLVKIGIQMLASWVISKFVTTKQASSEMARGLMAVYVNSFASAAAIPFVGWAIAPQAAMANLALATAGSAAAASTGAGLGAGLVGVSHGGMDNIPNEGTFLLDKGERVLAPQQNRDLTSFLDSGGGSGVSVGQLIVNINVPDSKALIDMDRNDWRDIVARSIIPALDALDKMGVRQVALERQRGS